MKKGLLFLLLIFSVCSANANWENSPGLEGISINCFTTSGNNHIMGTSNGLYVSSNNGDDWNYVDIDGRNSPIRKLCVSDTVVFALGSDVYVSKDHGINWLRKSTGLPQSFTASRIVAKGKSVFISSGYEGVYRSDNYGETWTAENSGLEKKVVNCFCVMGNDLYAGTYDDGVYVLRNGSGTWEAVNKEIEHESITSLEVIDSNLFAGSYGDGVYLSTNKGVSWSPLNSGLPSNCDVNCMAVSDRNIFIGVRYHGILISTDNGISWEETDETLEEVLFLTASGSKVYAGTQWRGLLSTSDNGVHWKNSNIGFTIGSAACLLVKGSNVFAVSDDNGICVSTDNGEKWNTINTSLNKKYRITAMVESGNDILAGTWENGLMRSTNDGIDWTKIKLGISEKQVVCLEAVGDNIYVAVTGQLGSSLMYSSNKGTSWTQLIRTKKNFTTIKAIEEKVYVCVADSGIFATSDNGTSWIDIGANLPANCIVGTITGSGENIYLGTNFGVFHTTNSGISWDMITYYLGDDGKRIYLVELIGSELYMVNGEKLFVTTDNGGTWESFTIKGNGNSDYASVSNFAYNNGFIFAGTRDDGVFRHKRGSTSVAENRRKTDANIQLMPNPVHDELQIDFSELSDMPIEISIVNSIGNEITKILQAQIQDRVSLNLNTSNYPSGSYYMIFDTGKEKITKGFTVVR